RTVLNRPGSPAVSEVGGRTLSYEQLWLESEGLAAALQERYAVSPGEPVGLLFANSVDFCIATLAVIRTGAVAATLNTKYAAPELEVLLSHCGARTLIVQDEWWPKVERLGIQRAPVDERGSELRPPDLRE